MKNTISENRLNGLTLLNIHCDIEIFVEKVVENMAKKRHYIKLI
jgi:hypothetical protein